MQYGVAICNPSLKLAEDRVPTCSQLDWAWRALMICDKEVVLVCRARANARRHRYRYSGRRVASPNRLPYHPESLCDHHRFPSSRQSPRRKRCSIGDSA